MFRSVRFLSLCVATSLGASCLVACAPVAGPDKSIAGAVLGAGWGAGAGAVVGNQLNDRGPGAAMGAAFGAGSGLMAGIALDVEEGHELAQHRELDALKVQVRANERNLVTLQNALDREGSVVAPAQETLQVFFDPNRASLRIGSAKRLERFAQALKQNPAMQRIHVHGHSDDTGDPDLNVRLSEARARTVQTFLAAQGISSHQLIIVPHGSSEPLASNSTPEGKQLNRRAEVVVLQ
ncbi:MAG: OmpA family protein [Deltaproteobacteria bacterium]|nr:OmpA family protein [Deltaproteobacteria bacterium]